MIGTAVAATSEPELSIVVPAFNEAGNLERVIERTISTLDNAAWLRGYEVIVVDDGSGDGTGQLAEQLAGTHRAVSVVHHAANRGFGAAVRSGYAAAHGRFVSVVPADGEVGVDQALTLLKD